MEEIDVVDFEDFCECRHLAVLLAVLDRLVVARRDPAPQGYLELGELVFRAQAAENVTDLPRRAGLCLHAREHSAGQNEMALSYLFH